MRTHFQWTTCTFTLLLGASSALADTVTFQPIPNARSADDMSPDGRFIVGETLAQQPYLLDRLTSQMTILPPASEAVAVSDDGTVVLGTIVDPNVNAEVAAIWTAASGTWTSLGYLPNALSCPSRSNGYELSADGAVAVGLSWDGCNGRGFRWTQATGMVELEPLANGGNRASVISSNGNVIGGFAQGSFSRTPAIWSGGGAGELLDPPDGDALGEIYGINDAGTILLGSWNAKASMWTYPALVHTQIGNGAILPGWEGIPQDISAAGTIVGFDFLGGNRRAWIRPAGNGPLIDLKTYIEGNGGAVPSGTVLEVCQAISADGRFIIGHGFASNAWLVEIVPSVDCPGDVPGTSANVDVDDLIAVILGWGQCGASCPADVTGDGAVDVDDLITVILNWGPCPAATGGCCTGSSCAQMTQAQCASAGGTYLGDSVPCGQNACDNNDTCAMAIDITTSINGAPVLGDNSTATPSFGGGDPDLPAGSPSCQFNQNPGAAHSTVWYTFVAPANGMITLALCDSTPAPFFDSTLALYSGSCGKLVEVACSEDDCAPAGEAPYYSRIAASGLLPGATYRVCVMNPGDWLQSVPGPFVLSITSP
jgi:uncharacterized membrane protein